MVNKTFLFQVVCSSLENTPKTTTVKAARSSRAELFIPVNSAKSPAALPATLAAPTPVFSAPVATVPEPRC